MIFPAFGSPASAASAGYVASTLDASPYAAAYRLANRLGAGAKTPYAFVERVYQYLQHGYTYSLAAPRSTYPIETFLFTDKYGYCQHFAGAMALLLRMGGIPARVAVGFTSGSYSSSTGEWVVNDLEAHAWVEAWVPTYGWVASIPTKASRSSPAPGEGGVVQAAQRCSPGQAPGPATNVKAARHRPVSSLPIAAIGVLALALALGLGGAGVALWRRGRRSEPPSSDELLAELERALRRSGSVLTPATTLAELERRFRRSSDAAEYVRAVGRARYAGGGAPPTAAQRRALRSQLAERRGTLGRLWALWALPPRV